MLPSTCDGTNVACPQNKAAPDGTACDGGQCSSNTGVPVVYSGSLMDAGAAIDSGVPDGSVISQEPGAEPVEPAPGAAAGCDCRAVGAPADGTVVLGLATVVVGLRRRRRA